MRCVVFRLIGISTDMFEGGIPPSPQAFAISHLLSMPPLVFSTPPSFTYIGTDSLKDFINPVTSAIVFPPASSWSVAGMVVCQSHQFKHY
jgi:hypothetical protein